MRSLAQLSDDELVAHVKQSARDERRATAALIAALSELDARKLYLGAGCSSLFTYCTRVLHLSEHAAYGRIEAARAATRFPIILALLADGAVTLTTIVLLAPHLTPDNHQAVLDSARHKTKRDVEHLVATLRPLPDVRSTIRKLPASPTMETLGPRERPAVASPSTAPTAVSPIQARPATIAPLAPERYKVQFTVSRETYDKLRRVQDLLRHTIPDGDPAAVLDRALTILLHDLERNKLASTAHPRAARHARAGSRHIPAAIRRAVWRRDAGQCAFIGTRGRCSETGCLEFHHVRPFADGGQAVIENIELRCKAHNAYEAKQRFGPAESEEIDVDAWRLREAPAPSGDSVLDRAVFSVDGEGDQGLSCVRSQTRQNRQPSGVER